MNAPKMTFKEWLDIVERVCNKMFEIKEIKKYDGRGEQISPEYIDFEGDAMAEWEEGAMGCYDRMSRYESIPNELYEAEARGEDWWTSLIEERDRLKAEKAEEARIVGEKAAATRRSNKEAKERKEYERLKSKFGD